MTAVRTICETNEDVMFIALLHLIIDERMPVISFLPGHSRVLVVVLPGDGGAGVLLPRGEAVPEDPRTLSIQGHVPHRLLSRSGAN